MEKISYRGITVTKYNNVLSVALDGELLVKQILSNADEVFASIDDYIIKVKASVNEGNMIHLSDVKKFILEKIER